MSKYINTGVFNDEKRLSTIRLFDTFFVVSTIERCSSLTSVSLYGQSKNLQKLSYTLIIQES